MTRPRPTPTGGTPTQTGTSPRYALPYPEPSATVDVPRDIKALALATDTAINASEPVVVANTSGEVTMSGTGVAGDGIKAALTGTRNGNWNATGTVTAGGTIDATGTGSIRTLGGGSIDCGSSSLAYAGYGVRVRGSFTGTAVEGCLFLASDLTVRLALYNGGATVNQFKLFADGSVGASLGSGPYRPFPFASYTSGKQITIPSQVVATTVFTFPIERFTQVPAVVVGAQHSSGNYYAFVSTVSLTSATIGSRHADNVVSGANPVLFLHAVQATPTSGWEPSLTSVVDESDLVAATAVCRVEGCENADVPIEIMVAPHTVSAWCGGCEGEITDVVLKATGRRWTPGSSS